MAKETSPVWAWALVNDDVVRLDAMARGNVDVVMDVISEYR